jgi:2'-hydroxyisoflavone reductase
LSSGSDATFTWANGEFLLHENVAPWSEMPLWLPENESHAKGAGFINCDKAVAAGLKFRELRDTIKDTLRWYEADRPGQELKAGIDRDREQALLRKWHETN